MVCEVHSSDIQFVKRLIGVSETYTYLKNSRADGNLRSYNGTKQIPESRTFLSGWETGVDSQLTPPKVVYTIRAVSNKRDVLGSIYGKNSARVSKPFVFIHSLEPEAYLKYYVDEHTYMANLFVQPSVQRLTACLIAPPSPSSRAPAEPSATPPQLPLPQVAPTGPENVAATTATATSPFDGVWSVAKKYSIGTGAKTQTRIQGALSEPTQQAQQQQQQQQASGTRRTASNLSQQVDLLTKKVLPASYFIISGRARGDIPGKSDSLSLISSEVPPIDSATAAATVQPAPPRRVSTPDRARQRDFTCAGFAPALTRRLELLAAAEAAAEATAVANDE